MDLVQVELDDDALPDTPRRARWSVRAWLRLTAVLAVLAAAAAVVQVRATSAAEARIAAVLGTTEDLTVAREEAWRVAGDVVLGAVDDVLVIRKLLGGATVVSLADGTPVWSRDTGICYLVDLDGGTPQVRTAERTRLVCQRWSGSPSGGLLGAEALDPTTGEVIAEAPLVSSGGGYVTSWREVLVSVGVDQSHRLIARGWSMVTGERTWTWTGEVDAVPQNDPWRAQGVLAVEFDGRRAVLDVETGTELTDLSGVPSREPEIGRAHV